MCMMETGHYSLQQHFQIAVQSCLSMRRLYAHGQQGRMKASQAT